MKTVVGWVEERDPRAENQNRIPRGSRSSTHPTAATWLVGMLLVALAATTVAAEPFEDAVAVKVKKGLRGPRGMPGDIVQLKDGSLLMSYTQNGCIMGMKSD